MTRCLVVGGNGFVGSHMVDELVRQGHEVGVFDRFSSGESRYTAGSVRQHVGDFLESDDLRRAVQGYQVIYHLMTTTTPATASADPLLDVRTNIVGSIDLMRIAADAGVEHFYFASSGGTIYGTLRDHAAREEDPTVPVSPYGIAKLTIERYLDFTQITTGMKTTSFRIANAYGPRQHPNRLQGVVPIFLRRILEGKPLQVLGDGSMARDYIYVDDVTDQIARTLGTYPEHAAYNIGSGTATTINEIVETIRQVTQKNIQVVHAPAPSTFVERITLDTTRYRAEYGETATVPLREGIVRTWKALQQ